MFKTWEEMTIVEQLQATYWDMYKDVHGFRPRHINMSDPKWSDETHLRAELANLDVEMARAMTEDAKREQACIDRFETRVSELIEKVGAPNRAHAIRWIHDAEGTQDDANYLCTVLGLPYGYFANNVSE